MKMHIKYTGRIAVSFIIFLISNLMKHSEFFIGQGFANIAIEAEVPIVPIFLENVDEMRWNPTLWLWNRLGLGRLFSYILDLNIPYLHHFLISIASSIWFTVTFFQVPIPAKITLHIGNPVQYDKTKDSIDDVSSSFFDINFNTYIHLIDLNR